LTTLHPSKRIWEVRKKISTLLLPPFLFWRVRGVAGEGVEKHFASHKTPKTFFSRFAREYKTVFPTVLRTQIYSAPRELSSQIFESQGSENRFVDTPILHDKGTHIGERKRGSQR